MRQPRAQSVIGWLAVAIILVLLATLAVADEGLQMILMGVPTEDEFGEGAAPPSGTDAVLMETGDYILMETGDKILLEN